MNFWLIEWAHLVKFKFKEVSSLFNEAAEIETGFYSREYAKRQYQDHPELKHHENFAVHLGENLMMPDADAFFSVAHHAPIRTTLMVRGWLESMMGAKEKMTLHPADFMERINEIPSTVANREVQVARLKSPPTSPKKSCRLPDKDCSSGWAAGNLNDRLRAAMILGRVGHPSDIPFAQQILRTTTEPQLEKNLFASIVNIADGNMDTRLAFLIENAKPGHPLREEALSAISGFQHPEARAYYDALRLSTSDANLPGIDESH